MPSSAALLLGCTLAAVAWSAPDLLDETSLLQSSSSVARRAPEGAAVEGAAGRSPSPSEGAATAAAYPDDIPKITVNLDLAPEQRWFSIYRTYAPMAELEKRATQAKKTTTSFAWTMDDKELLGEMRGIVAAFNNSQITVETIMRGEQSYEMGFTAGCTSIVAADDNGKVLHGRNFDVPPGFSLGKQMFEATFVRDNKPLFTSINSWGSIGVHTGFRHGKWSFSQNTRPGCGDVAKNEAAGRDGAKPFMLVARRAIQDIDDWSTAVRFLAKVPLMAPQYFIMAGSGPNEGAVISRDRQGSTAPYANTALLAPSIGRFFLAQTNDDEWKPPHDDRRPTAVAELGKLTPSTMNETTLLKVMNNVPVFNPFTVFTYMMQPATDMSDFYFGMDTFEKKVDTFEKQVLNGLH